MVSGLTVRTGRRGGHRSSRRARQLLVDFRKQSILAAARSVFARHGFAGTTVDLIARQADVAKGTLYLYYRSKSAIYAAALISGLEQLTRETVRVTGGRQPLLAVLRAFFETRQRFVEENLDFFRIYSTEAAKIGTAAAQVQREVARLQDAQIDALRRAIAAAVDAGEIRRVDPRTAALATFDLSHGAIVRRMRSRRSSRTGPADALELLWKGLSPR